MTIKLLKSIDAPTYGWTYTGEYFERNLEVVQTRIATAQRIVGEIPQLTDDMDYDDVDELICTYIDNSDDTPEDKYCDLNTVLLALSDIER